MATAIGGQHSRGAAAAWIALVATLAGCGGYDSYVKTDDAALGRVVIYRNGIAYFERKAHVTGGELAIDVPEDKVNDFLKSLTVADAKTGKALPVSFPTRRGTAARRKPVSRGGAQSKAAASRKPPAGTAEMVVQLPDTRPRDVVITYITDAPAWKPTYRVMVGKDGKLRMQGWAVIDNTSGEDWRDVRVGVGSSSALSFRYDLRSIRRVHREQLGDTRYFVQAPPQGGGVDAQRSAPRVLAQFHDDLLALPSGHPARSSYDQSVAAMDLAPVFEKATASSLGTLSATGRGHGGKVPSRPSKADEAADKDARRRMKAEQARIARRRQQLAANESRVRQLADQLKKEGKRIVIEGYAAPTERDGDEVAEDRAHVLRNQLIRFGVSPAQLEVRNAGVKSGPRGGVRLVAEETSQEPGHKGGKTALADAAPVGESHFESRTPLTVARGTSAMVSVVHDATEGEIVYLYEPDGKRGDRRYAFRAVRFRNPTDSTLEAGPVTVYGEGRFIGEGLTRPVAPHSEVVVPFAMDRQVIVERDTEHQERLDRIARVKRGVLTADVRHIQTVTFEVRNRARKAAVVFVKHRLPRGWTLSDERVVHERFGDDLLLRVQVGAQASTKVALSAWTPLRRTVDLRTSAGMALVRDHLEATADGEDGAHPLAEPLRALAKLQRDRERLREEILSFEARRREFHGRARELHIQIASLQLVRTARNLMRHLERKMKDATDRVQDATVAIVDRKEALMLARIKFEDELSELRWSAPAAKKT